VTVHGCLKGRTPPYLMDYCIPASGADTLRHLHSANRRLLVDFCLSTYGHPTYSVAGPRVWNSLQDFIRYLSISTGCSRRVLKTYLFAQY